MTIALPKRRGYTLLEIVLVMAILIILLAASIPSLNAWYGDTVIRGAADEIRRAWADARSRSIESGLPYRYCEKAGTNEYRIAPDSDEYWNGNADDGGGKAVNGALPEGIKFKATAGTVASGWNALVVFLPDGTAKMPDGNSNKDAQTELNPGDGSSMIVVKVRNLTGIVTVQMQKPEKGR